MAPLSSALPKTAGARFHSALAPKDLKERDWKKASSLSECCPGYLPMYLYLLRKKSKLGIMLFGFQKYS